VTSDQIVQLVFLGTPIILRLLVFPAMDERSYEGVCR
jgi:hypothetical protein